MPFSYIIHRDPDLHHMRFVGQVTVPEARQWFTVAMKDPRHVPGMPGLVDFTAMADIETSFIDVVSIRDSLEQVYIGRPRPIHIAILSVSEASYGMARMFQTLAGEIEGVDVQVYEELEPALAFLSLTGTRVADHVANDLAAKAFLPPDNPLV